MNNIAELMRQLDLVAAGELDGLNYASRELVEIQLARALKRLTDLVTGESCAWCDREKGICHDRASHTICDRHKAEVISNTQRLQRIQQFHGHQN